NRTMCTRATVADGISPAWLVRGRARDDRRPPSNRGGGMTGTRRTASSTAVLEAVHPTAFQSFPDAAIPIPPPHVLTGRNNSGKSNALDGIEVLSRLASGEEVGDALDGRRREGGPVRGGSRGCAPHGATSFELGCSVRAESAAGLAPYRLDVTVQV